MSSETSTKPNTKSNLPKLVAVVGPTASGKTTFSIELAKRLGNVEIVGADSMQVYRHFDIGSAKPSSEELAAVPHHLVSVIDGDEAMNAAIYKRLADKSLTDLRARGVLPLVVGGTGLYLRILIRGIFEAPEPDEGLRARLRQELEAYGVEHLYNRLRLVDPKLSQKVQSHDKNRIMRGLEIFEQTGIALSEHQRAHDFGDPCYEAFLIGLRVSRPLLYERIARRSAAMLEVGLLDEYRSLLDRGLSPALKPMMSLGYRQMGAIVEGTRTKEEAIADLIRDTKRYAKRQLTWFRKEAAVNWIDVTQEGQLDAVAADIARFYAGEPTLRDWATDAP